MQYTVKLNAAAKQITHGGHMTTGIIGAMDIEVRALIDSMENAKLKRISSIDYYSGRLYGQDIVVAKCGAGKVNAAVCTQAMIMSFGPETIINTGIAGGLDKQIHILDIVISDSVVEHDLDTTVFGDPPGFISGLGIVKIDCADHLVKKACQAAKAVENTRVFTGTIASGDQFISSPEQKNKIHSTFGALCAEMEGAAIGHVCYMNNTDFCIIRCISDNADGSAADMDYPAFSKKAAAKSIEIIHNYLKS